VKLPHGTRLFVKVNGKLCYLWRAVDHEGEVLDCVVTARRNKAAALKLLKRIMKKYGAPRRLVTDRLASYPAALKEIGVADRHEVGRRLNNRGEFASAVSTARAGHAAVSKHEDTAEIQLSSCPGPKSFQSGTSSPHPQRIQT
jgi:transposase-like protein